MREYDTTDDYEHDSVANAQPLRQRAQKLHTVPPVAAPATGSNVSESAADTAGYLSGLPILTVHREVTASPAPSNSSARKRIGGGSGQATESSAVKRRKTSGAVVAGASGRQLQSAAPVDNEKGDAPKQDSSKVVPTHLPSIPPQAHLPPMYLRSKSRPLPLASLGTGQRQSLDAWVKREKELDPAQTNAFLWKGRQAGTGCLSCKLSSRKDSNLSKPDNEHACVTCLSGSKPCTRLFDVNVEGNTVRQLHVLPCEDMARPFGYWNHPE